MRKQKERENSRTIHFLALLRRDGPHLSGADGEDAGLRRIDDGSEVLDAVHAQIADRKRARAQLL